MDGMELEAAHAVLVDEPARLARAHLALGGVDAREGNEHVVVLGRHFRDLFVGDADVAELGLGVHVEDHGRHLALAVVLRDLGNGRRQARLEVLRHVLVHDERARIGRLALRDVRVGVNVDGDEVSDLQCG